MYGRTIINQKNMDDKINVGNLANGVYSIRISDITGTITNRFVKQ
jgi:hypothetical protein